MYPRRQPHSTSVQYLQVSAVWSLVPVITVSVLPGLSLVIIIQPWHFQSFTVLPHRSWLYSTLYLYSYIVPESQNTVRTGLSIKQGITSKRGVLAMLLKFDRWASNLSICTIWGPKDPPHGLAWVAPGLSGIRQQFFVR